MSIESFFKFTGPVPLQDLVQKLAIECSFPNDRELNGSLVVTGVDALDAAQPGDLTFAGSVKFREKLRKTSGGFCFVSPELVEAVPQNCLPILCSNPRLAFALALGVLYPDSLLRGVPHGKNTSNYYPKAVDDSAKLEDHVSIAHGAVIGENVEIGRNTTIGPNAVIHDNVKIGRDCYIGAGCSIQHCYIGDRVIIHPNTSIGQDGYGFELTLEKAVKVPQLGVVVIQNDVEIGANSTIDRSALDETIVGEGSKLGELIHVGHNVKLGRRVILQTGSILGGSSYIGDRVIVGGNSVIKEAVHVGDDCFIRGMSAALKDLHPQSDVCGVPAVPTKYYFRLSSAIYRKFVGKTFGTLIRDDKHS